MNNISSKKFNKGSKILLKPKYDVVFQSLFSNKNKEETSYFISAILGRKIDVIQVDTEVSKVREHPKEKIGRMDLIAHTDEGEIIHIEIQLINYLNTTSRLLYSLCQNISKQLSRGEDYNKISKTITIGLLDYNMKELEDLNKMHSVWTLKEKNDEKQLTDLAEIHIIEMSKAKYEYQKDHNNKLAEWILFILDPNEKEVRCIMNENEEIKKTAEKLENLNEDEDIRIRAEIFERWEREEKWNKASLREGLRKEVKEEVREELKEEVKEEVKEEIKEEVREETKVEIVKKMLENNIDIDTISKITGINKSDIKK